MRSAEVYRNGIFAGTLIETNNQTYEFTYDSGYFTDNSNPPISLTLPKDQMVHNSEHLFPFFYNMLSEGSNREVQSRQLKIDENDFFGLLLATAQYDTIGAVTVKEIK
ncbi:MAG: HipA N-terminal domain-containing protein [Bacteroidota bacterium]|nr:HipA N-terminal domain-containing protein [Bacteroidota bacterium]MDP3642006.1 HipA N-terminal domain-containing protein [Bacteroidota bacterium]